MPSQTGLQTKFQKKRASICLFGYKDNIGFITIALQMPQYLVSILTYLLKVNLAISKCLFFLQHKFFNESVQLYYRSSIIILRLHWICKIIQRNLIIFNTFSMLHHFTMDVIYLLFIQSCFINLIQHILNTNLYIIYHAFLYINIIHIIYEVKGFKMELVFLQKEMGFPCGASSGEGMTTHCSILAWEIPWTEEPGVLQAMRLQRVKHD